MSLGMHQALAHAWRAPSSYRYQALSVALRPLSWLFGTLVALRRGLYKRGLIPQHKLGVPVIVVGNVMVGGVGKTPVTMALVQHFKTQGLHVGVLSRGYGRETADIQFVQPSSTAQQVGDEPLLIAHRCQVPVVVGRNRVEAGRALLTKYPNVQLLVCDDGLQHWQLARDLELCVFDERGIGNGHLLPAGPLRETWPRKKVNENVPCWVVNTAGDVQAHAFAAPRQLADFAQQADGTRRPLRAWGTTPVQALAGIAKPAAFFAMLREHGLNLSRTLPLSDHADMQGLLIDTSKADVLCTEKDAVKLWPQHPNVWAVPLQTTLPAELLTAIDQHLEKLSSPHGHQTT